MIVRDCHFNPHYNYISDIQNTWQYQLKNCEGFVVKNTKDLLMVQNFIFGASRGIVVDEGAGLYCIGHGTDGARISFEARGETDKKVTFINSQLVVIGSTESMEYINFDESFSGHIDLVQTNMWGNPDNAVVLKSTGSLRLCGGTIQNGGTLAVSTKGTNLIANNMMFFNTRLVFFVDSKSANVGIYGNQIAGDGNMLRDKNKIAWGSDI